MKFIRNALIGIAVYEAAKYLWNMRTPGFASKDHLQQLSQPHVPLTQNIVDLLEQVATQMLP